MDDADDSEPQFISYNPPKRSAIVKKVGILRRIFVAIFDAMQKIHRHQANRCNLPWC